MACIEKIYSVSALVGNGTCNANCDFCAGKYLRPQAKENEIYYKNLESAIKLSARYGGWSLSFTSAGEPTCDIKALTKAFKVYDKCAKQGAYFPNVNLFTNGINFGNKEFCDNYLPIWKSLGLTNVAISIHGFDEKDQAKAYNIKSYPKLEIPTLQEMNLLRQELEFFKLKIGLEKIQNFVMVMFGVEEFTIITGIF